MAKKRPVGGKNVNLPGPINVGKNVGNTKDLLPNSGTTNDRLTWRFTHIDHDSRWCFDGATPGEVCELLRKLKDFESMTIAELRQTWRTFKEYELPGGLCKDALDRLTEIGRDDMTKIQRLELTGLQRLYGFLDGHVFHIVWWDRQHEVYPSKLKHT
ncbi:hypothetical protein BX265_5024 [Streptomyces sp. TLI_235]|nr:hypothetical protein [Streptomyces sp. TLI_235]PBC71593.1 hypothetical protein BX265_6203 [Streptomyces sp. TLI_235]PBC80186.1 hypothetical protein BX265_5024 [Streptomyces sp. TLI_235]